MKNSISRIISRESFTISSVSFLNANQLIRERDFPAMLDNPLRLLMFPSSNPTTSEEEILWKIDGLKESLQSPKIIFRKVCKGDELAIGFAEWTIDKGFKRDGEVPIDDNKKCPVKVKPKKAKDNRQSCPEVLIFIRGLLSASSSQRKSNEFSKAREWFGVRSVFIF